MLSVIQIAGFLNQPLLQNKSKKQPHFLHVDKIHKNQTLIKKFKIHSFSRMELNGLSYASTISRKLSSD